MFNGSTVDTEVPTVIAFVDESVKEAGVGTYVVGCVITPHTECGELRKELVAGGRFHFRKAGIKRQVAMLEKIASRRLACSAYVYRGLYPIGQEGGRGFCFDRLLLDLQQWGVGELVIESRGRERDSWDNTTILGARHRGQAPEPLTYCWQRNDADPLLWMADAVAGAVRVNVTSTHERYKEPLGKMCCEIRHLGH